jgi:carbon monoxide dehydrogenase subunit G
MPTHLGIAAALAVNAVAVHELPDHVTEAAITIDASPSEVYALVTDYANWPRAFSDIRSVSVESGDRDHARVRFSSLALQHDVTVEFDNERDRVIRFKGVKGPPGGRAHGTYTLVPVDGGKHTRVTAQLYMDAVGVASVFVRDATIRSMRNAKLQADLGDLARHFARRA